MFILSRRYYHYQGIYSTKEQTLQRAKGLIIGGCFALLPGIILLIMDNAFRFFIPFDIFGGIFSIITFIPFIISAILFIVGISSFIKAKNMSNEDTEAPAIEYIRNETKKMLESSLKGKGIKRSEKGLEDLICPACQAPLNKNPPCKCEYCGRMIRG